MNVHLHIFPRFKYNSKKWELIRVLGIRELEKYECSLAYTSKILENSKKWELVRVLGI